VCQRCLGQEIVGESVGEARKRVRSQRCDDQQVGVPEVRIRVVAAWLSREREERLSRDESLRRGRDERIDVMARPDEQSGERARLVGRYPPGDAQQDAR
jgi:hypothetical protein